MSEKSILFSAPMVRAILADQKTVTRRVVNPQPPCGCLYEINGAGTHALCRGDDGREAHAGSRWVPPTPKSRDHRLPCPYIGSLWVREAWAAWFRDDVAGQFDWKLTPKERRTRENCTGIAYRATAGDDLSIERWVTPLFMPRWASRITLDVVSVRVERLHDITPEDAAREGVAHWWDSLTYEESKAVGNLWTDIAIAHGWEKTAPDYRGLFGALWTKINGRESWESNPFVWRVEFARR